MIETLELALTADSFSELHKAFAGKGKTISVDKEDLKKLLLDHGKLIEKLESYGVQMVDARSE